MTTTNNTTAQADQDFTSVKTIAAGPEQVLAALTTPEGVAGWWGTTSGSAGAVGDVLEVGFGTSRLITLGVASLEPGRIEWFVERAPFTPEWDGTSIVFELAPAGDGTELRFRHVGLTPQFECYEMCQAGWTHYLASLVAYAERGVGDPYRED
jgi:uncharacterized protein YndB with AHSA1/START domain